METNLNSIEISKVDEKIILTPVWERVRTILIVIISIAVFVISLNMLSLDIPRFMARLENFPNIARLFMGINWSAIPAGLEQLLVSFALGICGLIIGGIASFILAFCAADNTTFFKPLAIFIKAFVSIVRAVPNLVLILMIVASLGMGYTAGVLGLTLSTVGYLTKAFISTIEEQDEHLAEALKATGANWFQVMLHGYLPGALTGFIAWISIRAETSVAESISLGVIGAGGIGMMLARAIRQYDFHTISTLILIIFISMFILELAITRFRRKISR